MPASQIRTDRICPQCRRGRLSLITMVFPDDEGTSEIEIEKEFCSGNCGYKNQRDVTPSINSHLFYEQHLVIAV